MRHAGVTMSLYQLARRGRRRRAGRRRRRARVHAPPSASPPATARRWSSGAHRPLRVGASAPDGRRAARSARRHRRRALRRRAAGPRAVPGRAGRRRRSGVGGLDLTAGAPTDPSPRIYATGEAAWALARLHTTFPSEDEWGAPARRGGRLPRDRARRGRGAWRRSRGRISGPPTCSPSWRRPACRRNRRPTPGRWPSASACSCGPSRRRTGGRTPFVDAHARGAGLGVWVEGVGSLARVAEVDPRLADLRPALEERLACGAGLLAARQVDGGPAGGGGRLVPRRRDADGRPAAQPVGAARGRGPDRAGVDERARRVPRRRQPAGHRRRAAALGDDAAGTIVARRSRRGSSSWPPGSASPCSTCST